MRRREFSCLVMGAMVMSAMAGRPALAQQGGKIHRIGILESVSAVRNASNLDALRRRLRELGYVEGQNLVIEYRSAEGRNERFPSLASELAGLKLDLIVTRGTPATIALQNATGTVPVVMATMGGPGTLVASLARPGRNVTGVITFSTELSAKRVELLKELAPSLTGIALLHDMGNPASPPEWEETKKAAHTLNLRAELLDVRSEDDLNPAFERAVQQNIDGLVVGAGGLTQMHRDTIIELAARRRLLAIYPAHEFVESGGLIAYAVSYPKLYARLAAFVDKLLKGAKPSDLPVEQPTEFELAINLKTARSLGLTAPPSILARADEVIE